MADEDIIGALNAGFANGRRLSRQADKDQREAEKYELYKKKTVADMNDKALNSSRLMNEAMATEWAKIEAFTSRKEWDPAADADEALRMSMDFDRTWGPHRQGREPAMDYFTKALNLTATEDPRAVGPTRTGKAMGQTKQGPGEWEQPANPMAGYRNPEQILYGQERSQKLTMIQAAPQLQAMLLETLDQVAFNPSTGMYDPNRSQIAVMRFQARVAAELGLNMPETMPIIQNVLDNITGVYDRIRQGSLDQKALEDDRMANSQDMANWVRAQFTDSAPGEVVRMIEGSEAIANQVGEWGQRLVNAGWNPAMAKSWLYKMFLNSDGTWGAKDVSGQLSAGKAPVFAQNLAKAPIEFFEVAQVQYMNNPELALSGWEPIYSDKEKQGGLRNIGTGEYLHLWPQENAKPVERTQGNPYALPGTVRGPGFAPAPAATGQSAPAKVDTSSAAPKPGVAEKLSGSTVDPEADARDRLTQTISATSDKLGRGVLEVGKRALWSIPTDRKDR